MNAARSAAKSRSVARHWTARITVAPLRQGENADGLWQIGQHALEGTPGVRDGVQEHDGNARRISLLDIGESHPVGKFYRLDLGCRAAFHRFPLFGERGK